MRTRKTAILMMRRWKRVTKMIARIKSHLIARAAMRARRRLVSRGRGTKKLKKFHRKGMANFTLKTEKTPTRLSVLRASLYPVVKLANPRNLMPRTMAPLPMAEMKQRSSLKKESRNLLTRSESKATRRHEAQRRRRQGKVEG